MVRSREASNPRTMTSRNAFARNELLGLDLKDVQVPTWLQGFEHLEASPDRGKRIFTGKLACADCHSTNAGDENGYPNLADLSVRRSAAEIVTSILEPSREFARGYETVVVQTLDGEVITGRVDENELELDTVAVSNNGLMRVIPRNQIYVVRHGKSDMPEGLVNDITAQEFADLVAYLARGLNGNGQTAALEK